MASWSEPSDDEYMTDLSGLVAFLWLMGPILVLVSIGMWVIRKDRYGWQTAAIAAGIGTVVWLLYAALYEHETPCDGAERCPTVFGFVAPLASDNGDGGRLLIGGMLAAAAALGVRRRTPSITIGAFLVGVPAVLAWWTTPRGDNDGLWILIFLMLAVLGAFATGTAEIARAIAVFSRKRRA